MARQTGEIRITGTVGDLCFYEMEGKYFVRLKSSITPERYRKDVAFAARRMSAEKMKLASPLASELYARLPKEKKVKGQWQQLVGAVKDLLARGYEAGAVEAWFMEHYMGALLGAVEKPLQKNKKKVVSVLTRPFRNCEAGGRLFVVLPPFGGVASRKMVFPTPAGSRAHRIRGKGLVKRE